MICKKAQPLCRALQVFCEQALSAIQPHATTFDNFGGAICVTPTTGSELPFRSGHPNFAISVTGGPC